MKLYALEFDDEEAKATYLGSVIEQILIKDREYRPLEMGGDNYPKYLFTLDALLQKRNGIKHLNLIDFISKSGELV
ncbi:MAG: hypothetical protein Q4G65_12920 [bacterium]|nr:hypothetical protein [bacterium]